MDNTIVLIYIYYEASGYGKKLNFPPLGLAFVSEYLEEKNIDHHIIDMGLQYTEDLIIEKLMHLNPRWIGISLNSLLFNKTTEFIKRIKKQIPSANIAVGGPHVTTEGVKVFSQIPYIDFAIVAEGEISFYELVSGKPRSTILGLIYRDNEGKIIVNERRITEDINVLPFPKFKRFEFDKYATKIIPLLTSRGCPFKCIFCQQSSLLSKTWRGVSPKYFIENIKYWQERGYKEFHIIDDNFTLSIKRIKKIVELFEKENIKDIVLKIIGGIRIRSTNKKVLLMLKKINIDLISFGVESYSDPVLKFIKKETTEEEIEDTVKSAIELGYKVKLFFIIGFPYQTIQSLRNTYKFILKYPIYQVRFFNLIPYENTELMKWMDKNGEFIYPPNLYMNEYKKYQNIPVFKAKHTMSIKEREKELKLAREVERLVDERKKYFFDEID